MLTPRYLLAAAGLCLSWENYLAVSKNKTALNSAATLLKTALILLLSATFASPGSAQTNLINFDVAGNWTAGSGAINSYQTDHVYADANMTFTGGPALRETSSSQDGFSGALGTYAWRLQDNSSVVWTATYNPALGANEFFSEFGFAARRWDGSPSPDFLVEYSFNGGSSYTVATSIGNNGVIDNSALGNTSDWSTFTQVVNSPNALAAGDFIVRISAQGSTERLMIDDFFYTISTGSTPACNLAASGLANLICDDNGTPGDPTDDRFSFSLEPNGSNLGGGYTVTGTNVTPAGGTYGVPTFFLTDPGTAGAGDLNITIVDGTDPNCTFAETLTDPGTCSPNCNLVDAGLANIQCNSNGTPNNPNDDFFTFELDPTGFNLTGNYTLTGGPVSPGGANYGSPATFTTAAGTAGAGDLLLTITDASGGGCTLPVTVTDPGACSVPNTVYSQSSGSWTGSGIWNSLPDGTGTSVTNPDNPGISVIVQPGHTIEMASGGPSVNNLEVQPGATLIAGGGSNEYVQVYGSSVVVDGAMGAIGDGMSLDINGPACTISGNGSIQLSRLRKDSDTGGAATTNLTIATDVTLTWSSTAALYNIGTPSQSTPTFFNVTIGPGTTVTLTGGDVSMDGLDGSNNTANAGTLTINGELILQSGDLYVTTDNNSAGVTYNVNGKLTVGGQVIGNANNGSNPSVASLNVAGELELTGPGNVFAGIDGTRDAFNFLAGSLTTYSGPGGQVVESAFDYASLTIAGSGDKELNGGTTLSEVLTFSNARIDAQNFVLHIDNDDANAVAGGNTNGYLYGGGLRRNVIDQESYPFPVGSSLPQGYQNVILFFDNTGGVNQIDASFSSSLPPSVSVDDGGNTYTELLDNGVWNITPVGPGSFAGQYDITLAGRVYSNFRNPCACIKSVGGVWTGVSPSGVSLPCSESGGVVSVTRNDITSFSEFGIGVNGTPSAPLPITLQSFTASARGSQTLLQWRTATELNNDYMAVEHSTDGRRYEEIGRVMGAGTTQQAQDYRFTHGAPAAGLNYYRLRQVDYDGQYEYHGPVSVRFGQAAGGLKLFPTVVSGEQLNVQYEGQLQPGASVEVFTLQGELLLRYPFGQSTDFFRMDVSALPAGMYLLQLQNGRSRESARFVRQ